MALLLSHFDTVNERFRETLYPMGLACWWGQQQRRRQRQQGDGGRQGCRLTSRQTTVAAKIAAREVLMVCCQGDKDQPASVSFADANEGLRAPTDARLSFLWRCRLKPLVPREWIFKLHLSQRQEKRKTIHFLFLSFFFFFMLVMRVLCKSVSGKERSLTGSKYPTTPTSTSSLPSYSIDSLWWIGLFSVGGW